MGLDRDDTIIRRRLRQKLEFVAEEATDADAADRCRAAWLKAHPDRVQVEPEAAVHQIYLSPDQRGPAVEADARRLLAELTAAGAPRATDTLGDSLMLPQEVALSAQSDVARQFGETFADAVLALEPGQWAGPIRSGYGLHLAWIAPIVPRECRLATAGNQQHTPGAFVVRGILQCEGGIQGKTLAIDGLESAITDVMVRVHHADGRLQSHLLKPVTPSVTLGARTTAWQRAGSYAPPRRLHPHPRPRRR